MAFDAAQATTQPFLTGPMAEFRAKYNRASFMFDHTVHANAVFDLANLADLAARLPERDVYATGGQADVGGGWDQGRDLKRDVAETVRTIGETDALVMLKNVDNDPEFGPIFRGVVAGIIDHVGDQLRGDAEHGRATLLISSPRRVTAYHIDAEVNYLLQIRGSKLFHVFDGSDRSLVSTEELEAFYRGDYNAARWRDERRGDSTVYKMEPGRGVHVPIHSPHWVANDANVSVSMSVNYDLRSNRRAGNIHRINGKLRQLGLNPAAPGESAWRDGVKVAFIDGVSKARQIVRPASRAVH